jgi:TonB family protein
MRDIVSSTLGPRELGADGFQRMVAVSLAGHIVLVAVVMLSGVLPGITEEPERTVMTISLGGAPGPRSGGMTPLAGRAVQQVSPKLEAPRPEPVAPPAAKPPAMVLPAEKPEPKRPAPAPAPAKPAPERTTAQKPTTGDQVRAGSAIAETGAKGIGFGLSTGGGGTGGEISLSDFCCPEYLTTIAELITRNWDSRQRVSAAAIVRFTIRRDGAVTDVAVAQSSGYPVLDLLAQRAIMSIRVPPLPRQYTNDQLTIHVRFEYQP